LTGDRFITQLVDPVTAADPALFSKLEDSARRLIEEIKSRPTNSSSCVTIGSSMSLRIWLRTS